MARAIAACLLALGGCVAETKLAIMIRAPVDIPLGAQLIAGSLHGESGKNRCELTGGMRTHTLLPDGGVTPLTVGDLCIPLRCGTEQSVFGHTFYCECSGDAQLDMCLEPLP